MKKNQKVEKPSEKMEASTIAPAAHADLSCAIAFLHLILNEKDVFDKVVAIITEHYREKGMLVDDPNQAELDLKKGGA